MNTTAQQVRGGWSQRSVFLSKPRRLHLAAARMWVERHVAAGRAPHRDPGGILCYHAVGTPLWGVNDLPAGRFRQQIEAALQLGLEFVDPRVLADDLLAGRPLGRRVAVTFDDGLRSVARNAAPVLASYGIPWMLFAVTDWVDGHHQMDRRLFLDWDELGRLGELGMILGSHSVSHADAGTIGAGALSNQLGGSRARIRERLGMDVVDFAIAYGQAANWPDYGGELARGAGYKRVYAQSWTKRPPGTVPRTFVSRFDDERIWRAALGGVFDGWEEWV